MEEAVQRGVVVRVLLDHVAGLRTVGYRATRRRLTSIGVKWHLMLPFAPLQRKYERPDLRNHRKLLVVDGLVGWMGSQNIIDSSYRKKSNLRRGLHWKDAMVRLKGPIVAALDAIFLADWFSETDDFLPQHEVAVPARARPTQNLDCQLVPSGPGFATENNLRLFLALLYAAQKKIIITSPYFVPDESLLYAVTAACQRGVRVELFVSEIGDQALVYHAQRSYYEALLEAGVIIWLYKKPTILHSKHMSIDDEVAVRRPPHAASGQTRIGNGFETKACQHRLRHGKCQRCRLVSQWPTHQHRAIGLCCKGGLGPRGDRLGQCHVPDR
jgi:cardiolipin synthase